MSKYYTNVCVHGNHILFRGVNNGRRVKSKVKYSPSLFVQSNKQSQVLNEYYNLIKKNNIFINHLRVDKSITNDSQKSPSSISGRLSVNKKQNAKNNQSFCSSHITPLSVKNAKNEYKNIIRIKNELVTNNEDRNIRQRFYSLKDKPVSYGENGYPSIKLDRISDNPTQCVNEKPLKNENNMKVETTYFINDHSTIKDKKCVETKEVEESPIKRNNNHQSKTNDNLCNSYKDTLQLTNLFTKTCHEKTTEFNGTILFYKKT